MVNVKCQMSNAFLHPLLFALRPLPFALYPLLFALCPSPFALRPLPFALCPSPFTLLSLPFALCPLPFALCYSPSVAYLKIRKRYFCCSRIFFAVTPCRFSSQLVYCLMN